MLAVFKVEQFGILLSFRACIEGRKPGDILSQHDILSSCHIVTFPSFLDDDHDDVCVLMAEGPGLAKEHQAGFLFHVFPPPVTFPH